MASTATARRAHLVEVLIDEPLDHHAAARVQAQLLDALNVNSAQLIVNLSRCPYLDATAVQMLVDIHRRAWQAGTRLTLHAPTPRVRRALTLSALDHALTVTTEPPADPRTLDHQPAGNTAPSPGPALPGGHCR